MIEKGLRDINLVVKIFVDKLVEKLNGGEKIVVVRT